MSAEPAHVPHTGSLARRMMLIAFGWIALLLVAPASVITRITRTITDFGRSSCFFGRLTLASTSRT